MKQEHPVTGIAIARRKEGSMQIEVGAYVVIGIKISTVKLFKLLDINSYAEFNHDILTVVKCNDKIHTVIGKLIRYSNDLTSEPWDFEYNLSEVEHDKGIVWQELMRLGLMKALKGQWEIDLHIVTMVVKEGI